MTNLISQLDNLINTSIGANPIVHYAGIVLMALFGIICCLYGFKLMRVLSTALGAMIGCAAGYEIAALAGLTFPVNAVVVAVCALIFGLLGFFLRRPGIFLVVFCGVFSAALSLLTEYTQLDRLIIAIIALVAGVVLSILSVIYDRPLIIISTALVGGMLFSNEVFEHLVQIRWDSRIEMYARLGAGAVLALIGIIFQFVKTRQRKA
ncbi:MAG: DUF4203 domain-containing protein [Lachnospiraceae bacterium]|nr:DUF4203 domain-containing protein [Lachnospiraceae bacterium]